MCEFLVYAYWEQQVAYWIGLLKNKTTQTHFSDLGAYTATTYSEVCMTTHLSHLFYMTKSFCVIFDGCILNTCKTGTTVQQVTKNQYHS